MGIAAKLVVVAMASNGFSIADPERYIDPATGQVLVRFVNEQQDSGVGFQFQISISGEIS